MKKITLILLSVLFLASCQSKDKTHFSNIINVYVDGNNQLFVNDTLIDIANLRSKIKDFLDIHSEGTGYPEKHFVDIPKLGNIKINKEAIVGLKNERNTLYKFYIQVQNELIQSIHELWNELSIERFGKAFDDCSKKEQKAVEEVYPRIIIDVQ